MKLHSRKDAESGQAIVLVALFMVVLLGFTGLAIDGGGLFFLNRDAQNAVDASVLAAAYAKCVGGDINNAALTSARENGFDNSGDDTVTVREGLNVVDLPAGIAPSQHFVQVDIEADKPSFFIQIVYPAPLSVQARATAYCKAAVDTNDIPGIMALGTCGNTINFSGSQTMLSGSMHSNGEISSTGSNHVYTTGPVTVTDPPIEGNNITWVSPAQEPTTSTPEKVYADNNPLQLEYSMYRPGGVIWENVTKKKHIYAGQDPQWNNGPQRWEPQSRVLEGLYMVEGDVEVKNNVTYGPDGVTIVATGDISFDSADDAPVQYYSEVFQTMPDGVKYPAILLMTLKDGPCGNASTGISMDGPSNSVHGVIYAPRTNLNIGSSSVYITGVVITESMGSSQADLKIIVDKSLIPPRPPLVQYAQ